MTVIDSVICLGRACYKQTLDTFQPSRLTGVRLRSPVGYNTAVTAVRDSRTKQVMKMK